MAAEAHAAGASRNPAPDGRTGGKDHGRHEGVIASSHLSSRAHTAARAAKLAWFYGVPLMDVVDDKPEPTAVVRDSDADPRVSSRIVRYGPAGELPDADG